MNGVEMLLVAVGLAMDAFAVSVGKGLTIQGQCKKACIVTGLYFGGFQLIMPLLGFLCGESFIHYIFYPSCIDWTEYVERDSERKFRNELSINRSYSNDPGCHCNEY